jgi:hypothetical protein
MTTKSAFSRRDGLEPGLGFLAHLSHPARKLLFDDRGIGVESRRQVGDYVERGDPGGEGLGEEARIEKSLLSLGRKIRRPKDILDEPCHVLTPFSGQ